MQKLTILLLKHPFLHLFILILGMIIIRMLFISSIAYCAYPWDTWSSVYEIDNPPDLEYSPEKYQPTFAEKAIILQKQQEETKTILSNLAVGKDQVYNTTQRFVSLTKLINNKDFPTSCSATLQQLIIALNKSEILKFNEWTENCKYSDPRVMEIHKIYASFHIPLAEYDVNNSLLYLLKQTKNPILLQLYCLYAVDTYMFYEAQNYKSMSMVLMEERYLTSQSDVIKLIIKEKK